jgi:DNA-binding NarL/FixJ family response regulator
VGYRNSDIALQPFIGPANVEHHPGTVYRKLGAASRTQLARVIVTDDT